MRAECVDAVQQAVGRKLTTAELDGIEQRVVAGMRQLAQKDRAAYASMSKAEQLSEAAKIATQDLLHEVAVKAERAALQTTAIAKITERLDAMGDPMKSLDGLSRLLAFHSDTKGGALSIESTSNAIRNEALSRMLNTLEASNPKFFGMLENEQGIRDIIGELHGKDTGNADAKAGAKSFKEVAESLRQRFNRAGGDVGQLEDWGMPHHHSQMLVAKAGREQWVADVMPLLNREKYVNLDGTLMNDQQLADFLGESWTTIATDGANKMEPGRYTGVGARANRGKASRQIHFKDGDAYVDYQNAYGERGLYEILVGHISGAARDISLVETLGPNPDLAFRTLNETYAQKAKLAKPTKIGEVDKKVDWNNKLYQEVAGKQTPVASQRLAGSFDAMRNWMVSTRLGSAIISSFADEASMAVTARLNGISLVEMWRNEAATLNPANQMEKRLANRAGLALNSMIADLNRFANDSLKEGVTSRLAGMTMRLSGLNALTDARRRAFGTSMMSTIGRLVKDKDSLSKLDKDDYRLLLAKGLDEQDWQLWRKAGLEDWGGGNDAVLTPEAIYAIPDADVDAAIAGQIQGIRDAHQGRIDELQQKQNEDQQRIKKRFDDLQAKEDATGVRIADRIARFDKRRAEIEGALKRLVESKQEKAAATQDELRARSELLAAKVEQARVRADIDAYLRTETQQARVIDFLQAVEDGASIDPQVVSKRVAADRLPDSVIQDFSTSMSVGEKAANSLQRFAGSIGRIGEELGRREGMAKQRITELKAKSRDLDKMLAKELTGKSKTIAARIKEMSAEVDAFIERANERNAAYAEEVNAYAKKVAERQANMQRVIEAINKDIEPRIAAARQGAREQAATRLLAHVLEETNMAVIEPGSRERTLMHIGAQRGTWKGELVRSVWLFKSFGLSMITRHAFRGWDQPGLGKAYYIASLAATTTVLGALSVQVNEILNGRDPRNMASWRFAYASLMKGGGLGILGDFAFADTTQYGNSMLATAAGPMAGMLEDVDKLTRENLIQAAKGDETHAGAELVRFIKGNIPVVGSLWYTKAALNHLFIHQLQEWASPGYLQRMESRARREFGQEYWWEPEDVTPERGPDLSKGWQ